VSKTGLIIVDTSDIVSELEVALNDEFPNSTINITKQSLTINPIGSSKFTGQLIINVTISETIDNQTVPLTLKISIALSGEQTTGSTFVAVQNKNPVDTISSFITNKVIREIASRIKKD